MTYQCRFQPERGPLWSFRLGFMVIAYPELDDIYDRAKDFMLQQKRDLHWPIEETTSQMRCHADENNKLIRLRQGTDYLFCIAQTWGWQVSSRLSLPSQGSALLELSRLRQWRDILEDPHIFRAGEAGVVGPDPIRNIFYMLQAIYSGVLYVECIDANGRVSRQFVPPFAWVQEHADTLEYVLGLDRYGVLTQICESHLGDDIEMHAAGVPPVQSGTVSPNEAHTSPQPSEPPIPSDGVSALPSGSQDHAGSQKTKKVTDQKGKKQGKGEKGKQEGQGTREEFTTINSSFDSIWFYEDERLDDPWQDGRRPRPGVGHW
ncbi:hypothetical protein NEOLEDRAFT_1135599 [Neolentinus lepideus HHB14362 ss-1]|uniref:Uncharacterized protein n=1 Tax=Neolentinus lepideus HHB14362 ss-1 TaxID=1314782 RepID=A0A165RN95_9AGAM|nr:hypothetical protein NEOLEDRAFT_1135599 [Neolentinus lepideus HHB14362 ss-1]